MGTVERQDASTAVQEEYMELRFTVDTACIPYYRESTCTFVRSPPSSEFRDPSSEIRDPSSEYGQRSDGHTASVVCTSWLEKTLFSGSWKWFNLLMD